MAFLSRSFNFTEIIGHNRNKSILLKWNTRNNLVDSRSLNRRPRHPNPKTPQLSAIPTQKRPILGAYQSFSLRCFGRPRRGACDVQYSVPRSVIKKKLFPGFFHVAKTNLMWTKPLSKLRNIFSHITFPNLLHLKNNISRPKLKIVLLIKPAADKIPEPNSGPGTQG